jgi:hypothetical protein
MSERPHGRRAGRMARQRKVDLRHLREQPLSRVHPERPRGHIRQLTIGSPAQLLRRGEYQTHRPNSSSASGPANIGPMCADAKIISFEPSNDPLRPRGGPAGRSDRPVEVPLTTRQPDVQLRGRGSAAAPAPCATSARDADLPRRLGNPRDERLRGGASPGFGRTRRARLSRARSRSTALGRASVRPIFC